MSSPLHLRRVSTPPVPVAPLGFSTFFSTLSRSFFASPKQCAKPTRRNPTAHHRTSLRLPLSYQNLSARPKTAVSISLLHTPSHRSQTTFWANPSRLVHARGDPSQRFPHLASIHRANPAFGNNMSTGSRWSAWFVSFRPDARRLPLV